MEEVMRCSAMWWWDWMACAGSLYLVRYRL